MRVALLLSCGLLATTLCGMAQAESSRRTLQGSTEPAADAPGWDGRLPEGIDPRSLTGAGSRPGLDSDYGAGRAPGRPVHGWVQSLDTRPCGWNPGPGLPGSSHSAGSINGGSFSSTLRCADGYPGLPLRQRSEPAWGLSLEPPYRGRDEPPFRW